MSEKERGFKIESSKEKEQIVTCYIIDCRRHGEKEKGEEKGVSPALAEKGKEQARMITKYKPPYATGDVYVSEIERTTETGRAMQETEWKKGKEVLGLGEGKIIKTERLGADRFWYSNKEFIDTFFKIKQEKGVSAAFQWYLDFKDKKPYGEIISPEESAASYTSIILDLVKKLEMGEEKSKTGKLPKTIISHDFPMQFFLYFIAGEQIEKDLVNEEGKNFMEKMGGVIEPAEGFTIELKKGDREVKGTIFFRGKKYDLDIERMSKLAEKYRENWEK